MFKKKVPADSGRAPKGPETESRRSPAAKGPAVKVPPPKVETPAEAKAKAAGARAAGTARKPPKGVAAPEAAATARPASAEPPAAPPATPRSAPSVAPAPPPKLAAQPLADVESRIRKAVDDLERRLASLPGPAPETPAAGGDVEEVTASFRRALGEAIDRKLEEVIAPAVSLYQRLLEEARELREEAPRLRPSDLEPILADALGDLEKILRLLGGDFIQPRLGEHYDPLSHQAVGESGASGGAEGVVADVVRSGYRSARGKVVVPAKVVLGRR